jgi:hypothetical protein
LEGTLVFHDSIRKWFELQLAQPQCEHHSIELVPGSLDPLSLQVLRGCRVRSSGATESSPTGYFSLDLYQSVDRIEAVGSCAKQAPFPDYSQAKPDPSVRAYRVDMHLVYEPGDHPIRFRVSSQGKELRPWQAYAGYMLTGGFALYGYCGEGFAIGDVFGTQQAHPARIGDAGDPDTQALFDPENAAAAGTKDLRLGYTCVRTTKD